MINEITQSFALCKDKSAVFYGYFPLIMNATISFIAQLATTQ